jgi:cytidylate kinase
MTGDKITIAIDGYSACGKSTLARELADQLGYIFIDSGAMYRGVTLYALRNELISDGTINKDQLVKSLSSISLRFVKSEKSSIARLHLNNEDVEDEIRRKPVSDHVSPVSAIKEVRTFLVDQQQRMGVHGGIVMDGRDIGTVVFPKAELKLFITASIDVRVKRRLLELKEKGIEASEQEVRDNLTQRDYIDSTRAESPLKQAEDAIVIDNSVLSRAEQLSVALELATQKINSLIRT